MRNPLVSLTILALTVFSPIGHAQSPKPTVVLVHGAFADGSSWNGVIRVLRHDGYPVVAAALPLRSLHGDAQYVREIVTSLPGSIVLVGHSYAGSVTSEAAYQNPKISTLVYVDAFAPETGETASQLTGQFPGSTLGPTLAVPVPLSTGDKDLYVQQDRFPAQFAADVPIEQARLMAATQRPVTEAALNEHSSAPGWKEHPSWFIYGSSDKCIPPAASDFMARRAHAIRSVVVNGGSHVLMVSHPNQVAKFIETAARASSATPR